MHAYCFEKDSLMRLLFTKTLCHWTLDTVLVRLSALLIETIVNLPSPLLQNLVFLQRKASFQLPSILIFICTMRENEPCLYSSQKEDFRRGAVTCMISFSRMECVSLFSTDTLRSIEDCVHTLSSIYDNLHFTEGILRKQLYKQVLQVQICLCILTLQLGILKP